MKKIILIFVLFISSNLIFAQSTIDKGMKEINAGFGLDSWSAPIHIGFDYGVYKNITVGAQINLYSYEENWLYKHYILNVWGISGNANYHFNEILNISNRWDLYAGINLGFYVINSPAGYGGSIPSSLGFGAQLGGRYFFSSKWGINLEFGGGNSVNGMKIGVTYRF